MDGEHIDKLIPDLSHGNPTIRRYAARLLGIDGEEQAVPFLFNALASGEDPVRRAAAQTLGQLGDAGADARAGRPG